MSLGAGDSLTNRTSFSLASPRRDARGASGPDDSHAVPHDHVDPYDPAVVKMQERMKASGIDPGVIDGLKGPLTRAAMARYQARFGVSAAQGLPVDPSFAELQSGQHPVSSARGLSAQSWQSVGPWPAGASKTTLLPLGNLGGIEALVQSLGSTGEPAERSAFRVPGLPRPAAIRPPTIASAHPPSVSSAPAPADKTGVPGLIAKMPTGSGTVMGFVTVTVSHYRSGIRISAGDFGQFTIDKSHGQWIVQQPGKPDERIRLAIAKPDGSGGYDCTVTTDSTDGKSSSPITFHIENDGRTLVYDGHSIQLS